MADHRILYFDKNGYYKGNVTQWFKLEYARKENDFGSLYIDLPPVYSVNDFDIDGYFEVWRKVAGYDWYLDMDGCWFIRLKRYKTDDQGNRLLHILAYDQVHLLERRVVAYLAKTAYADKTGPACDVMKAYARENFSTLATDAARNLFPFFTVDPDYGDGPTVTREATFRKILPLFQEIADEATNIGTYTVFDVPKVQERRFKFTTYTGQRGTNRGSTSKKPFYATLDNGVLSYASLSYDHSEERNYIYAGGRGEDNNRVEATAYDNNRINISLFNRCEDFIDAKETDEVSTAQSDANQRLNEAKPKTVINGHIQQLEGAQYGIDYTWGDIIACKIEGQVLDIHLNSAGVTVESDGSESVQIYSRNLDENEY